jgi:uncharacterized membrane protein YoaT (DUF817 family)
MTVLVVRVAVAIVATITASSTPVWRTCRQESCWRSVACSSLVTGPLLVIIVIITIIVIAISEAALLLVVELAVLVDLVV